MNIKKYKWWLITLVGLLLLYAVFLFLDAQDKTGNAPVISFDDENIEISVKDEKSVLLKGVHASDAEDGDLDDEIVVESISTFDQDKNRIVTYCVFDSDQNVTKAQRRIHYKDYTKSKFYLTDSFSSSTMNTTAITNMIKATSCVDGDISGNVVADISTTSDSNIVNVSVSVKDSTGETSSLELKYTYDLNNYTTDIRLKSYLVYVKKGQKFNAEKNLSEIDTKSVGKSEAETYLNIDTSKVNYEQSGVYEITYTFNYYGDNGFAKCIVVVE